MTTNQKRAYLIGAGLAIISMTMLYAFILQCGWNYILVPATEFNKLSFLDSVLLYFIIKTITYNGPQIKQKEKQDVILDKKDIL